MSPACHAHHRAFLKALRTRSNNTCQSPSWCRKGLSRFWFSSRRWKDNRGIQNPHITCGWPAMQNWWPDGRAQNSTALSRQANHRGRDLSIQRTIRLDRMLGPTPSPRGSSAAPCTATVCGALDHQPAQCFVKRMFWVRAEEPAVPATAADEQTGALELR